MQTIHPIWPAMPRHLRGHPWLQVSARPVGHHVISVSPVPGFTTGTPSTTAPARSTATCSEGQYPGWDGLCSLLTAQPGEISRLTPISFHCTYCTKTVNAWATVFLPMLPYIITVHLLLGWICAYAMYDIHTSPKERFRQKNLCMTFDTSFHHYLPSRT